MDGFLIIDKPVGMTSHTVVNRIRKATGEKKSGHTGTLDPFAVGVLPVALGEATKAIRFLDESIKEYRAVMRLGITTDTQDSTGSVMQERDWTGLSNNELVEGIQSFIGPQFQTPPMYSAIKSNGTPLYKLARRGVEVEREARKIEIFSINIESIGLPFVTFFVACSRGTYVRTLANDIGERLGCGAHLTQLQRTRSGIFTINNAVSIEKVIMHVEKGDLETVLISPSDALKHIKEIHLNNSVAKIIGYGSIPPIEQILDKEENFGVGEWVKLLFEGKLLAIAEGFESNDAKTLRLLRVFN